MDSKVDKIEHVLRQYFGFSTYKPGQKVIIEKTLAGSDIVAVMPTGSGKSLCFQATAMLFEGTTFVVSPLISLMKDQVDTLRQNGIPAAFINSSLSLQELREVTLMAQRGEYKLLYLAPERMELDSFRELVSNIEVSFLVVDEAHCISQWGHNFRPSYLKVTKMIEELHVRPPVAAFTATATPQVMDDINKLLGLNAPFSLVTGFDRENLYFEVNQPADKFLFLSDFLKDNKDCSGIIYCSTRKTVENVCEKLNKQGFSVNRYHAGLSDSERVANQDDFLYDRVPIIVATNAFGMGIDKSNIRFVIHYNMPKTMEHYYQEAGRAGRDGEKAQCILLYSTSDIVTNKFLIENNGENAVKESDFNKLQKIIDYCNITGCLRRYILQYFGEEDAPGDCKNCSNCLNDLDNINITVEAQKILSCIVRTGQCFGSGLICDVLRGSQAERILSLNFDSLSTYGIMREYPKNVIREMISFLVAEGLIAVRGGEYPVLKLTPAAYNFLKNGSDLFMKKIIINEKTQLHSESKENTGIQHTVLFENLRRLRKTIADEQNVPPFVVFSDATLADMCRRLPIDRDAMLEVSGVGDHKLANYGERFMRVIIDYVEDNNLTPPDDIPPKRQRRSKDKPKKNTRLETLELYNAGKTVEEICEYRGLTRETIEGHLFTCHKEGILPDYKPYIPEGLEEEIIRVINTLGKQYLKPIKEALPPEVSYSTIKYMIWKLSAGENLQHSKTAGGEDEK